MKKTTEPLKLERRKFPSWVVFLFCFSSVLLLIASIRELPHHFAGAWYYAAFGIFKVVLWAGMSAIYIPETISRLKGAK